MHRYIQTYRHIHTPLDTCILTYIHMHRHRHDKGTGIDRHAHDLHTDTYTHKQRLAHYAIAYEAYHAMPCYAIPRTTMPCHATATLQCHAMPHQTRPLPHRAMRYHTRPATACIYVEPMHGWNGKCNTAGRG